MPSRSNAKTSADRQSLNARKIDLSMTAVQGELFLAGGCDPTFLRYNPSSDTWTRGNPPILQHDNGALVYHGEKVYLLGGKEEDRVEEYNLDSETWSVCDFRIPKKLFSPYALALDI